MDYIHIDDLTEALIAIMERGKNGSIYNIGTGVSWSCRDVVALLQKILNTNQPVNDLNIPRKNPILEARADISKIFGDTGWTPRYGLKEGLQAMLISEAT